MNLTSIDIGPEMAKVICLHEARDRYSAGKCKHKNMTIDEELNTVECDDCHEKLNPVAMLLRFAKEESRWMRSGDALRKLQAEIDSRVRCKCQHCGKITRIRGLG